LQWYFIEKPINLWSWDGVQSPGAGFLYPARRSPYARDPLFGWTAYIMGTLHTPLMILGFIGAIIVWWPKLMQRLTGTQKFASKLTSLMLLYITAVHMVGAPFPRYAIPFFPLVYSLGIFCLWFVTTHLTTMAQHYSRNARKKASYP